jgi:ubiquinone/menaquinone biosynthesis C-methylase UbiE
MRGKIMGFKDKLAVQLRQPTGWLGRLVGWALYRGNRVVNEWVIAQMDIQPNDHILEVGFGPGQAIQQMAKIASNGFVAGVDFSEVMVRQAGKRNAAAIHAGRVELKYGAIPPAPYPDEMFHKVMANNVFYFWPEPLVCLQELGRVLKPGGLLALYLASPESINRITKKPGVFKVYTSREVTQLLIDVGFSGVAHKTASFKIEGGFCVLARK